MATGDSNPLENPLGNPVDNSLDNPANPRINSLDNPLETPVVNPLTNPIANPIDNPLENLVNPGINPVTNPFDTPLNLDFITFSPISGPVGTRVNVTSSQDPLIGVQLNNVPMSIQPNFDIGGVDFIVPNGATSGRIKGLYLGGSITSFVNFNVTTASTLAITSFGPSSGGIGSRVDVYGSGFNAATQAGIGNTFTTTITKVDDTHLFFNVPTGATTGLVSVKTATQTATSNSNFTVSTITAQGPFIFDFTPKNGPVGTPVIITGQNFTSFISLKIGTFTISPISVLPDRIDFIIPQGATSGFLEVKTQFGTALTQQSFTVGGAAPLAIFNFSPVIGAVNSRVDVFGTGFNSVTQVGIGTAFTNIFTRVNDGQIFFNVPQGATTGKITLQSPTQTVMSTGTYTVTVAQTSLTISSFSPGTGLVGSRVDVFGTGFNSVIQLGIGAGFTNIFTRVSDTQLFFNVPPGATTGKVTLQSSTQTVLSLTNFTVQAGLVITSFTPGSGAVGSRVDVFGAGMNSVTQVRVGNGFTNTFTKVNDTVLFFNVPQGATTGKITLQSATQTVMSAGTYTVEALPTLTISSFTPTAGTNGTRVDVFGTGMNSVTQLGVGTGFTNIFTKVNDNQLFFNVFQGATTGKITLQSATQTVMSAGTFTVNIVAPPPPIIFDFNPKSGQVGTTVVVTGQNFSNFVSLKLGNLAITPTVTFPDRIEFTIPQGATTGKIEVKTQFGTALTTQDFTVQVPPPAALPRPLIKNISPLQVLAGATSPTTITVRGSNLKTANAEKLFAMRCPNFINMEIGAVTATVDSETGDDVLQFPLKVTSTTTLTANSRVMIQFLASLRPNADQDLLAEESNHFITVLANNMPVPMGYTNTITAGESQILMVVGRNMQGTTLKLKNSSGVEVLDSRSEDRYAVLVVSVPNASAAVPGTLELTNAAGTLMGNFNLTMANSAQSRTAGEPLVPKLIQTPGQQPMPPKKGNSKVYRVRNGQILTVSDPNIASPNLLPGAQLASDSLEFNFPLFDEVVFLSVTDRGGVSDQGEEILERAKGKLFLARNLDFLIVLQIQLVVSVEVIVIFFDNPFEDYDSIDGFNAFGTESPDGTFGTITETFFLASFDILVFFAAGLVLPPAYNKNAPTGSLATYPEVDFNRRLELRFRLVGQFELKVNEATLGFQFEVEGIYFRVEHMPGKYLVRPRFMGTGLRLLTEPGLPPDISFPEPSGFGLVAYFFAEEKGTHCFEWVREGTQVKFGFANSTKPPMPLFTPQTFRVCLPIKDKDVFELNIVPQMPTVELGTAELLWVYRIKVENAGKPNQTKTIDTSFIDPSTYTIKSLDTMVADAIQMDMPTPPADEVKDWYLVGKQTGSVGLSIVIDPNKPLKIPGAKKAGATPFLAQQNPQFDLVPNVLQGLFPLITITGQQTDFPLPPAEVVDIKPDTETLNEERNRLWTGYVKSTAPTKTPAMAWEELSLSKKAIFLTLTHRLYYTRLNISGAAPVEAQGIPLFSSFLSQVTDILTLRGSSPSSCVGTNLNRIFLKTNSMLARALSAKVESGINSVLIEITDEAGTNYPGMTGTTVWTGEAFTASPFGFRIITAANRPPRAMGNILKVSSYVSGNKMRMDTAKLKTILTTLKSRTAPVAAQDTMTDQIVERVLGTTVTKGSQVCLEDLPEVFEFSIDYGGSQCTERKSPKFMVLGKEFTSTGRRIYAFNYGHTLKVDYGWKPTSFERTLYLRSREEIFGLGNEDAFINRDPYPVMGIFPPMPTIVSQVIQQINTVTATTTDAKVQLMNIVRIGGARLLGRGRAIAKENAFANADDRVLYWARLKVGVVLKENDFMRVASDVERDEIIREYERASRGYDGIQFSADPSIKRVIVTGFDPFQLGGNIQQSNPSGASALALHGMELMQGTTRIQIQTMIFPVRYRDFQQDCGLGVVESSLQKFIMTGAGSVPVNMIMTLSQTGSEQFEVDRFASRFRGRFKDNELLPGNRADETFRFPDAVAGEEFYETTLPFAKIVPANSVGTNFNIFYNNRFRYDDLRVTPPARVEFVPSNLPAGTMKLEQMDTSFANKIPTKVPSNSINAVEGSGGDYLSNEIFYRVSRMRALRPSTQPILPTGHYHIPKLQFVAGAPFDPSKTKKVIDEIVESIKRCF